MVQLSMKVLSTNYLFSQKVSKYSLDHQKCHFWLLERGCRVKNFERLRVSVCQQRGQRLKDRNTQPFKNIYCRACHLNQIKSPIGLAIETVRGAKKLAQE